MENYGIDDVESRDSNAPSNDYNVVNVPLVIRLAQGRDSRRKALKCEGRLIGHSVKSSDSWLRTIFLVQGRAIDVFFVPWVLVTINATVWTCLVEYDVIPNFDSNIDSWGSLYSLVLTTTLAFLLVFRLNRVAVRWWDTRRMWGSIVASSRILAISILVHASHAERHRDDAIGWLAGFLISVKQHIRGQRQYSKEELGGFLRPDQMERLSSSSNHPCLYCVSEMERSLCMALEVTADTPVGLAVARSSALRQMERSLHVLIHEMGGLERVKSTPLPLVYVTHLRTFLMIYLLSLPYVYAHAWSWATVPAVCVTAYALLGIDGAAAECERPFQQRRLNHLDMEAFCLRALDDMDELVTRNAAGRGLSLPIERRPSANL